MRVSSKSFVCLALGLIFACTDEKKGGGKFEAADTPIVNPADTSTNSQIKPANTPQDSAALPGGSKTQEPGDDIPDGESCRAPAPVANGDAENLSKESSCGTVEEPACVAGAKKSRECEIEDGVGTQDVMCEASGEEVAGSCTATKCAEGYFVRDGKCEQDCVPGAASSQACTASGGMGAQERTCDSGGKWGAFVSCKVSSCPAGNYLDAGTCKKDCNQNATQSRACEIAFGKGKQMRSCKADGHWSDFNTCRPSTCAIGRIATTTACVSTFCAKLFHDDNLRGGGVGLRDKSSVRNYGDIGFNDDASSIYVVAGCNLNAWQDVGFQKGPKSFNGGTGGAAYTNLDQQGANDDISSSTCYCQ